MGLRDDWRHGKSKLRFGIDLADFADQNLQINIAAKLVRQARGVFQHISDSSICPTRQATRRGSQRSIAQSSDWLRGAHDAMGAAQP